MRQAVSATRYRKRYENELFSKLLNYPTEHTMVDIRSYRIDVYEDITEEHNGLIETKRLCPKSKST
jgi:hypothetical protein